MKDLVDKYLVSEAAADKAAAKELELYISNDSTLYRQQTVTIQKNLMTKKAQGKYDSEMSVKLWMYLMDAGAKKYAKDHANPNDWNTIFTKETRIEAAKMFRDEFEENAENGEYDKYIPKKYQNK
jgi:hypothetical protein